VVRLHIGNGNSFLAGQDRGPALLWFGRAWYSDDAAGAYDVNHRLRIGQIVNTGPELAGLAIHDDLVLEAAADATGNFAVTLTKAGAAYVCELATARKTPLTQPAPVTAIAIRPPGDLVVTGSADGTAYVWDAVTGKRLQTLNHGESVDCVAFAVTGNLVATVGGKAGVMLWDVTTGGPVGTAPAVPGAYYAAFAATGDKLLTADTSGFVRVWDTATGEPLSASRPHAPRTEPERMNSHFRRPVFTPDGSGVITSTPTKGATSSTDYEQWLWPALAGDKPLWGPVKISHGRDYAFSPDGKFLLAAGASNGLFDLATGKRLATFVAPRETQVVGFLTSNRCLVGSTGGLLQEWTIYFNPNSMSAAVVGANVWGHACDSISRLIVVNGRGVVTAGRDGTVRLYQDPALLPAKQYSFDCGRAHELRPVVGGRSRTVFSGDGLTECRYGDGPARVGRRGAAEWPIRLTTAQPVLSVVFSGNSQALLTWDSQNFQTWRAADGTMIGPPVARPPGQVFTAISDDGALLAVISWKDRMAVIYDTATGDTRATFSLDPLEKANPISVKLRFSPSGELLAIADDNYPGILTVWDIPTASRLCRSRPHRGLNSDLEFSDDSNKIIIGSSDTTARLLDTQTGAPAGPPLRASSFVRTVALAPDGRRAATADSNGSIQLWDATTGEQTARWSAIGAVPIWFSRDGRRLIADTPSGPTVLELVPFTLPSVRLPRVLDLITGRRIDPATEGIEYLPTDTFTRDPDGYVDAWKIWRARLKETRPEHRETST
jgi:WD40 repeat protein